MRGVGLKLALVFAVLGGCEKVPLVSINAGFTLADAVWFEEEQTLFIFYHVQAEQGIEPASLMELQYQTDTEALDWTPLESIVPIHTHLPVECGPKTRCGSWSLKVEQMPRAVGLRLRYHPEGSLALETRIDSHIVFTGPAHTNRSALVYGVFDESNTHVQWRTRHQFPNLRNDAVHDLGLRRRFRIAEARSGDVIAPASENPYWYAANPCVGTALLNAPIETSERAMFEETELPLVTAPDSTVCALSTVVDAKGVYEAVAVARKNPEVKSAFPTFRTPVRQAVPVNFILQPCNRSISNEHLSMQIQRLLLDGAPTLCLDDWEKAGFASTLAASMHAALETARAQGQDMVLNLAFHHDDPTGQLAGVLADALTEVLVPERDTSTPRAVGAFILDSYGKRPDRTELHPLVLWCPSLQPDAEPGGPNPGTVSTGTGCEVVPDFPDLILGPFSLNLLPILPTRTQYLDFISKYTGAQAGKVGTLKFLAPQLTPLSKNFPFGEFGVVTFFNNEIFTPALTDALSYCPTERLWFFQIPGIPQPILLSQLPQTHLLAPQPSYIFGLGWDSPFLLKMTYEVVFAGTANAFGFSVPFGIRTDDNKTLGNSMWEAESFDLSQVLYQCTRFCDHPMFDTGGVYQLSNVFREKYTRECYFKPVFPNLGDKNGGTPRDP